MPSVLRRIITALCLLALPVILYTILYLAPLAMIGRLSVDNGTLGKEFPTLAQDLSSGVTPNDEVAKALLFDLQALSTQSRAEAGRLLNQDITGYRSLLINTGKAAEDISPTLEGLIAFDKRWAEQSYWDSFAANIAPWTTRNYERVLGIAGEDGGNDVYLRIMGRTLLIGVQVVLMTLLIGYPLAYAVVNGAAWLRKLVLTSVLISFWTSILVRTAAWIVLLQTNGMINKMLLDFGIIAEPLQLIFNRFGTVVAMTHVLLPFAILPIINVMRDIPTAQLQASRSLGAGAAETFLKIYFPQTLRGVAIGGGTVFILGLGFYVTPALVGGPGDQMLAYYISDFVQKQLNWGMASTLSVLLLCSLGILLALWGSIKIIFSKARTA